MVVKSIAFAALTYGITIGISLLVAGIITILYLIMRRRQNNKTKTDVKKEV